MTFGTLPNLTGAERRPIVLETAGAGHDQIAADPENAVEPGRCPQRDRGGARHDQHPYRSSPRRLGDRPPDR
ncbi:hypothetical protein [Kitasatospora sp. NPDC056531]|uniref:hypothetical protein n=1 Tax=Kitasatospora sp. NPDC056531 TaxID=3345856 RepID=UPI0036CBF33F